MRCVGAGSYAWHINLQRHMQCCRVQVLSCWGIVFVDQVRNHIMHAELLLPFTHVVVSSLPWAYHSNIWRNCVLCLHLLH